MSTAVYPPAWTEQALCAQVGGDLWFPEPNAQAVAAQAVCRICPVRTPCLAYALERPGIEGVWGGFSEWSRDHITGRQHRAGMPAEDIIAADDARYYARIEAAAERGTYEERHLASERDKRRVKREAIEARQERDAA